MKTLHFVVLICILASTVFCNSDLTASKEDTLMSSLRRSSRSFLFPPHQRPYQKERKAANRGQLSNIGYSVFGPGGRGSPLGRFFPSLIINRP